MRYQIGIRANQKLNELLTLFVLPDKFSGWQIIISHVVFEPSHVIVFKKIPKLHQIPLFIPIFPRLSDHLQRFWVGLHMLLKPGQANLFMQASSSLEMMEDLLFQALKPFINLIVITVGEYSHEII